MTYTLTSQQVASILGVPRQRVVDWERKGHLTCERLANGHRRFDAAEVEALAATLDRAPGRWARLPRGKRSSQPERGGVASKMKREMLVDPGALMTNAQRRDANEILLALPEKWDAVRVTDVRGEPALVTFNACKGNCAAGVVFDTRALVPLDRAVEIVASMLGQAVQRAENQVQREQPTSWTGQTLIAAATEAAQRRERNNQHAAVKRLQGAVELVLMAKPGNYPIEMDGGVPVATFDGWRFRRGPDRGGRWTLQVAAPCACWRIDGYPWAKAEIADLADLGDLLDGREPKVHTCEGG